AAGRDLQRLAVGRAVGAADALAVRVVAEQVEIAGAVGEADRDRAAGDDLEPVDLAGAERQRADRAGADGLRGAHRVVGLHGVGAGAERAAEEAEAGRRVLALLVGRGVALRAGLVLAPVEPVAGAARGGREGAPALVAVFLAHEHRRLDTGAARGRVGPLLVGVTLHDLVHRGRR